MRIVLAIFIYVCQAHFPKTESSKILGLYQYNAKSHFIPFEALMKALAARGHQVTVLSHFPQKSPVPNYTDIDVSGAIPDVFDNITVENALSWQTTEVLFFLWESLREMCRITLRHPNALALLDSTQDYDVVITSVVGSECTIGFAHKFKAPLIHYVSTVPFAWVHARIGNPNHPAYMPNIFLPYTPKMTFWQRLTNVVCNTFCEVGNYVYNSRPTSVLMREIFGDNVPSVEQLARNASLVLVNCHFSITWPRPAVPGFVEVGGLHIEPPKKLPEDLQKFFNESEHGVVYFNMGSSLRVQSFPSEKLNALVEAFSALPERVLMKFTGDILPGKPANVMIIKWVPQVDVLSHPKTKLFISHGGIGGVQETVYAGVPVVGIPLFSDQTNNINSLQELGMATRVNYDEITTENLLKSIRKVIDARSYTENARRVSALFRDRPMSPMDTAVYWVEYVIRHRGAPHLRSAGADLPLYQYLLLDVIAVLLLVLVGSIWVAYCAVKVMLRLLCGNKVAAPCYKDKQQ